MKVQTPFTMKTLLACFCFLFLVVPALHTEPGTMTNPLSAYSIKWNDPAYRKANTAAKARYLGANEKQLIFIINLARTNPRLFAETVLKQYPEKTGKDFIKQSAEYKSLMDTLLQIKSLPMLAPDSLCWISAYCHALSSGKQGYAGHERVDEDCMKKQHYYGECCSYGYENPLDIFISLLIDEGVPSLGHRKILLLQGIEQIGISIQPHTTYGTNTVLDFY